MALFKKKKRQVSQPMVPAWSPTVDLATARPAVFSLANAHVSNDMQVRAAIADFVRLSERPSTEDTYQFAAELIRDPECTRRPWAWLAAVMRDASAAGDHHLAAAALSWACYWTSDLVPRNSMAEFIVLELDPIPEPRKAEILSLGVAAAKQLPVGFAVVGDEINSVRAGPLADKAATLLGL